MSEMSPQAITLNAAIAESAPAFARLFARRGSALFFPKEGIMAQSAEAKGVSVSATLGEGVGDDGLPLRLSAIGDAVKLDPRSVFPYTSSFGKPELRAAWLSALVEKNPSLAGTPVSLPVVTAGLTHALALAGFLFVDEGDTVLLPDPYWDNYNLVFEHAAPGTVRTYPLFSGGGLDTERFRAALAATPGKHIILLNFPNNPSGYTPTAKECDALVRSIADDAERGHDVLVICDDAYTGLVFEEGVPTEPLFARLARLHERVAVVKVDGVSKEDFGWGLRVGFLTFAVKGATRAALVALEEKAAAAVRATISSASHLSQSLLLAAFASPTYRAEKEAAYQLLARRYRAVRTALANPAYAAYFTPLPCNSGYFLCLSLPPHCSAEQVRKLLISDFSTGVIALPPNLIRIAFSSVRTADIPALFDNLAAACSRASSHA